MTRIRALRVHELGEPEAVLRTESIEAPEPGRGAVQVEVAAGALNFPDVLICRGGYQVRPPLPFTPGAEVAGRVLAVGEGVDPALVGRRVIAVPDFGPGGFTEITVARASQVFPIPDTMPDVEAAALHVTYQTGHLALHRRAAIRPGETLLVHAGAGGVGSAAIQLGLAAGARVLATAGGPEKVAMLRDLGVEVAIDYRAEDFVEVVKAATGGAGADVIFDPVGGDTFDRSRKCIAFEGRLLVIGFTSGRIPEAPANHALVKNYSVVGVHWGLYNTKQPERIREIHGDLVDLHARGAIRPLVHEVITLDEVPAALTRLASRGTTGKVVWAR
ncbi:MAG: NADPH:quinone oxidoreductase family protein [Actinomycetes bacterium]